MAAESIVVISAAGSERIVRAAFEYAKHHGRRRVTLVHKANILKRTQGLFLEIGRQVASEFAGVVECDERIVDAAGMDLVVRPQSLDVLVMTNLHGDILSDVAAGLVGGLGLAPGANIGASSAMFEAVHGTAPDIAGKGVANPTAMLLAACLMLDHVGQEDVSARIREAVSTTLNADNVRTRDLGGHASTREYVEAVCRRLQ